MPLYDVKIVKAIIYRVPAASAREAREIAERATNGRQPRRLPIDVEVVARAVTSLTVEPVVEAPQGGA